MIVICRKIIHDETGKDLGDEDGWLKVGEFHVVLSIRISDDYGLEIYIQSRNGAEPIWVSMDGFEVKSQKIPASWITSFNTVIDNQFITKLPQSWDYKTFFEDVFDGDAKTIEELYNPEVDKMIREEGFV